MEQFYNDNNPTMELEYFNNKNRLYKIFLNKYLIRLDYSVISTSIYNNNETQLITKEI